MQAAERIAGIKVGLFNPFAALHTRPRRGFRRGGRGRLGRGFGKLAPHLQDGLERARAEAQDDTRRPAGEDKRAPCPDVAAFDGVFKEKSRPLSHRLQDVRNRCHVARRAFRAARGGPIARRGGIGTIGPGIGHARAFY